MPELSKEDAMSPSLLFRDILITSVIDAYERIKVVIFDVPGAFLMVY